MDEGWTDVGLNASWWGGVSALPTCRAPNNVYQANRRDVAVVCPALLPYVVGLGTYWTDEYSVHAAVQLLLDFKTGTPKVQHNF